METVLTDDIQYITKRAHYTYSDNVNILYDKENPKPLERSWSIAMNRDNYIHGMHGFFNHNLLKEYLAVNVYITQENVRDFSTFFSTYIPIKYLEYVEQHMPLDFFYRLNKCSKYDPFLARTIFQKLLADSYASLNNINKLNLIDLYMLGPCSAAYDILKTYFKIFKNNIVKDSLWWFPNYLIKAASLEEDKQEKYLSNLIFAYDIQNHVFTEKYEKYWYPLSNFLVNPVHNTYKKDLQYFGKINNRILPLNEEFFEQLPETTYVIPEWYNYYVYFGPKPSEQQLNNFNINTLYNNFKITVVH